MLTPRQELLLRKVVDGFSATGQPVGSKALAADPDVTCGPSTIRNELAVLEELGLLAHPHTSAGPRADRRGPPLLRRPAAARARARAASELRLELVRREVDEAMRVTTETLSQVTNLLAIVSAPPIETTTIRHVEVLVLQPQVLMVVIITSTGGVSKRVFTLRPPGRRRARRLGRAPTSTSGSSAWASARACCAPSSPTRRCRRPSARSWSELAPAFTELAETAENTLYVDGAARLMSEYRFQDVSQLNALLELLERRVSLLGLLTDGARRARHLRAHRRARTRCRRCSRCRWWPPTTACRSATSARSR